MPASKSIEIINITGTGYCGTTKFAEMLCEQLNRVGSKALFVGESWSAMSGVMKTKDELKKTDKFCQCGLDYQSCSLWGQISTSSKCIPENYRQLLEWAAKREYQYIIDSSKAQGTIQAYTKLGYTVKNYLIVRPFFSWIKSCRKHKNAETSATLLKTYIITNVLSLRLRPKIYLMRRFPVEGIFAEHKHAYMSNENKFIR